MRKRRFACSNYHAYETLVDCFDLYFEIMQKPMIVKHSGYPAKNHIVGNPQSTRNRLNRYLMSTIQRLPKTPWIAREDATGDLSSLLLPRSSKS